MSSLINGDAGEPLIDHHDFTIFKRKVHPNTVLFDGTRNNMDTLRHGKWGSYELPTIAAAARHHDDIEHLIDANPRHESAIQNAWESLKGLPIDQYQG